MFGQDLLYALEQTAITAYNFIGSGKPKELDKATTNTLRFWLNHCNIPMTVCLSEYIKDDSFGFPQGEMLGVGECFPRHPLIIDPVDGSKLTAFNRAGAITALAIGSTEDTFLYSPEFYMFKLACGPRLAKYLNLTMSLKQMVEKARSILCRNISVCILDRPRHEELIAKLRGFGVKIRLLMDGDITSSIAVCSWDKGISDTGLDLYCGIGGVTEGLLACAALKCLKGKFEGAINGKIYKMDQLVKSDCAFLMTGITDGMIKGIRQSRYGFRTQSLIMDCNMTRKITTWH